MSALLNKLLDFLATEGTFIEVYHLVLRLIAVTVIVFNQLDTFFVARRAATKIRGVLLHVASSIADVELVAAARAVVAPQVRFGEGDALCLV